jgi:hypothetical protein
LQDQRTMSHETVINADNTDLQPLVEGPCVFGRVDNVNGPDAVEVPGFVATRAELLELVKHWEEVFLSRAFFMFETGQIGSTDIRLAPFAARRVVRICRIVG